MCPKGAAGKLERRKCQESEKPSNEGLSLVAGAGFEPATSGL